MRIIIQMLSAPPKRHIGAEKYDIALAKYLQAQGHDVSIVLVDHPDEQWTVEGIPVNSPVRPSEAINVIISHADLLEPAKALQEAHRASQVIAIIHNESKSTLQSLSDPLWTAIIYNSHWIKGRDAYSSLSDAHKLVLYPPVTTQEQPQISTGKRPLLVNAAILKGAGDFIQLALLRPTTNFLVVEGGWGRQETKHLKKMRNVEVWEHQPSLHEAFQEASCVLVLSMLESWCMVATEAMAYGVPTLTYKQLGGVCENIGTTGLQVARGDAKSLLRGVDTLKPSESVTERFRALQEKTLGQLAHVNDYISRG